MYAEIKIDTDALPANIRKKALEWFEPTAEARAALDRTVWHGVYDLLTDVVIAKHSPSHTIIIFKNNAATLTVHVELTTAKPNVRHLKDVAEEVASDVTKFVATHGIRIEGLKIKIFVEQEHLETGKKQRWLERVLSSARKEIPGRLAVPMATFLVSMMLDSDVKRATTNALAALAGVLIWLLLSATLEKAGYRYE
jgi:hypothetical protein